MNFFNNMVGQGVAPPAALLRYRAALIPPTSANSNLSAAGNEIASWANTGTLAGYDLALPSGGANSYKFATSGPNGTAVVLQLGGNNRFVTSANVPITGSAPRTLAYLFNLSDNTHNHDLWTWGQDGAAGGNASCGISVSATDGLIANFYNERIPLLAAPPTSTWLALIVTMQAVAANWFISWRISSAAGVLAQGSNSSVAASTINTLAGPLNVGNGVWAGRAYQLQVADLQLFNTVLTTAQQDALRADWRALTGLSF